jgi:hypothetical protein
MPKLRMSARTNLLGLAFYLALTGTVAIVLSTPTFDHGIEPLSWELEVFPGEPAHMVNGTVQDVYATLQQLNPGHPFFAASALVGRGGEKKEDKAHKKASKPIKTHGDKDYEPTFVECNRWSTVPAQCYPTEVNIYYLVDVPAKPVNGPGWGNCGRVACDEGAAIFWCNDVGFSPLLRTLLATHEAAVSAQNLKIRTRSLTVTPVSNHRTRSRTSCPAS